MIPAQPTPDPVFEQVSAAHQESRQASLAEIAREFLRLGFIAFGGPAAHIALMEQRFIRERGWVTREKFLDLVGAVSLLPGPSSTELAIYLGQIRGGLPGLLIAGGAFILPAAIMVAGLAWAYAHFGALPQVAGLLFGVKPVVVVLIAQAVWALAKTALKSWELGILAIVVLILAIFGAPALALLVGTGLAWLAANYSRKREAAQVALLPLLQSGAVSGPAMLNVVSYSILLYFLKVGAILFGSGYVLLAVLRADLVVRLHWITETQLLDAIAVSQATPGPFFTVATFLGYLLHGWQGAALATAGMFLPAFFYVAITAKTLSRLRQSPLAALFLDGVNAAAVALMAFVGWQFARATLLSISTMLLAACSALVVFRLRINSAWVILGGALAGLLLFHFHFVF
jgi:chromate transporter